jgi:hypothetical protein
VPPEAGTPTTLEVLSTTQRDYDRLKAKLKRIDIFEVQLCFTNCDLVCRSSCFLILCDLAILANSSSRVQLLPRNWLQGWSFPHLDLARRSTPLLRPGLHAEMLPAIREWRRSSYRSSCQVDLWILAKCPHIAAK